MFKVDLHSLSFVKSIDLTPYNCVPQKAQFARMCKWRGAGAGHSRGNKVVGEDLGYHLPM